jgi:hypothetical protein
MKGCTLHPVYDDRCRPQRNVPVKFQNLIAAVPRGDPVAGNPHLKNKLLVSPGSDKREHDQQESP